MHVETIDTRDIEEPNLTLSAELKLNWMDPIFNYLNIGALSEDKLAACKVTRQAPHYVLYDGKLYKRSFTLPLLKCLPPSEEDYALKEVYNRNHLGDRALTNKIL